MPTRLSGRSPAEAWDVIGPCPALSHAPHASLIRAVGAMTFSAREAGGGRYGAVVPRLGIHLRICARKRWYGATRRSGSLSRSLRWPHERWSAEGRRSPLVKPLRRHATDRPAARAGWRGRIAAGATPGLRIAWQYRMNCTLTQREQARAAVRHPVKARRADPQRIAALRPKVLWYPLLSIKVQPHSPTAPKTCSAPRRRGSAP